ncbi:MAG: transposase [Chloracidobacterium sp.]|nr:transposase [Chloracidobacterium sp.]
MCGICKSSGAKIFDAEALEWLQEHARRVFAKMDCNLPACDGEEDHLHFLMEYPPKLSVSVMVNAFKGTSRRATSPRTSRERREIQEGRS